MEKFKHVWIYDGVEMTFEGEFYHNIEQAIEQYLQEEMTNFKYAYTLVWDLARGTCHKFNVEDEMALRAENQRLNLEAEAWDNAIYGTYQEQNRAYWRN